MVTTRCPTRSHYLFPTLFEAWMENLSEDDPAANPVLVKMNPLTMKTRSKKDVVKAVKAYCVAATGPAQPLFAAEGLTDAEYIANRLIERCEEWAGFRRHLLTDAAIAKRRAEKRSAPRAAELRVELDEELVNSEQIETGLKTKIQTLRTDLTTARNKNEQFRSLGQQVEQQRDKLQQELITRTQERDWVHDQLGKAKCVIAEVQGKLQEKELIIRDQRTTIQDHLTTIQDLQTKTAEPSTAELEKLVLSKSTPTKGLNYLGHKIRMDAVTISNKAKMELMSSSTQLTIAAMTESGGHGDVQATNLSSFTTTMVDGLNDANKSFNDSMLNNTSINTDGGEDRNGRIEPGINNSTNRSFDNIGIGLSRIESVRDVEIGGGGSPGRYSDASESEYTEVTYNSPTTKDILEGGARAPGITDENGGLSANAASELGRGKVSAPPPLAKRRDGGEIGGLSKIDLQEPGQEKVPAPLPLANGEIGGLAAIPPPEPGRGNVPAPPPLFEGFENITVTEPAVRPRVEVEQNGENEAAPGAASQALTKVGRTVGKKLAGFFTATNTQNTKP